MPSVFRLRLRLRILITGGAGFVGRCVGELAAERGHAVTLADLHVPPGDAIPVAPLDVTDPAAVDAILPGHDAVIHCAALLPAAVAERPREAARVNVAGTANVLETARTAAAAVITLSTATLYGTRPGLEPCDEYDLPSPVGLYDATKLAAEVLCRTYRDRMGLPVAALRTSFVYGPGHSTGDYFVDKALAGVPVVWEAGADSPCEFTYVRDLSRGLVLAAEALAARRPEPLPEFAYNVASGVLRTRGEFAGAVRAAVPGADIRLGPGLRPGMNLRGPCRIDRARRDVGWAPEYSIETGVADWVRRARGL